MMDVDDGSWMIASCLIVGVMIDDVQYGWRFLIDDGLLVMDD